jgi:metal-responsive CopG/Arc/MetJ family transcriptional regulator
LWNALWGDFLVSRIIQVPMDDELLASLDALAKQQGQPRARVIREACQEYLAQQEDRRLDEIYAEGYRRIPEDPAIGLAQAIMAAEVLSNEEW